MSLMNWILVICYIYVHKLDKEDQHNLDTIKTTLDDFGLILEETLCASSTNSACTPPGPAAKEVQLLGAAGNKPYLPHGSQCLFSPGPSHKKRSSCTSPESQAFRTWQTTFKTEKLSSANNLALLESYDAEF